MSTPTAVTAAASDAPPPKAGKRKLLVIIAVAVLALALVVGGIAFVLLKKKADVDEEVDDGTPVAAHSGGSAKHDAKSAPPVFVPLDPFTVNLADKEGERYLQVAVTLEIEDAHFGDELRQYLPAIRNNILMVLAQKTSAELLSREGKELLARQILRESLRPMGIHVAEADAEENPADDAPAKKKKQAQEDRSGLVPDPLGAVRQLHHPVSAAPRAATLPEPPSAADRR
jgi:flagellar protein FliL